jgi:hypothetical protein
MKPASNGFSSKATKCGRLAQTQAVQLGRIEEQIGALRGDIGSAAGHHGEAEQMNRATFYARLRRRDSGVFGTSLSQKQGGGD